TSSGSTSTGDEPKPLPRYPSSWCATSRSSARSRRSWQAWPPGSRRPSPRCCSRRTSRPCAPSRRRPACSAERRLPSCAAGQEPGRASAEDPYARSMNEAHDRAPQGVPRPLTIREREALIALIARGTPSDGAEISADDRKRWLEQVPSTHAGARCRCGTCPSIDLTDEAGTTADGDDRVVLEASAEGALLLL